MTLVCLSLALGKPCLGIPIIVQPADLSGSGTGLISDASSATQQFADDFVVTSPVDSLEANWFGIYAGPTHIADNSFTLRLFDATAGVISSTPLPDGEFAPGTLVIDRTAFSVIPGSSPPVTIYRYSTRIDLLASLSPGQYAFSVINDTSAAPAETWFWWTSAISGTAGGENVQLRFADNVAWNHFESTQGASFNLSINLAPEPGGAPLIVLASGMLIGFNRRRQTSND